MGGPIGKTTRVVFLALGPLALILEVDTASHSELLYTAEGENILYFTIEKITFLLLKFCGSVSELIWA